jgi:predicted MFS family arabinose efflux permease
LASTIAINSYFQKIAIGPEEITPNVSLGQTINHIAAVVVPVTGGILWESIGSQSTFIAGVVIVLACLILTFWMCTPQLTVAQVAVQAQPAD